MQAQSYTLEADSHSNRYDSTFPIFLSGSSVTPQEWKETIEHCSDVYSTFMNKIKVRRIIYFFVLLGFILALTLGTTVFVLGSTAIFVPLTISSSFLSNYFTFFIIGIVFVSILIPFGMVVVMLVVSALMLYPIKQLYNKGREELKAYLEEKNNAIFMPKGIQLMVQPREYLIFTNKSYTRLSFLDIQVIWLNAPQPGVVVVQQQMPNQMPYGGYANSQIYQAQQPQNPFTAPQQQQQMPPAKMPAQTNQYVQYKNEDEQF